MSWQLLTAISVLTLSSSVLLQRVLLGKDRIDPFAYASFFQFIVGVILSVFVSFYGFKLPGIENLLIPAFIAIVAYGVGHILIAKSLQTVEASVFSVLFASQSVWIMLLGIILFHERMSAIQVVGAVLIFTSVLMLVNRKLFYVDKGTMYSLIAGALFALAITAWSYVGRYTDGLTWAALSFFGTALVSFLVRPSAYRKMSTLFKPDILAKLLLLGLFYGVGSLTMLFAYREGLFSIVTPVRQSAIIVTTLMALLILKSERTRITRKLLAAVTCFVGVVMIVI